MLSTATGFNSRYDVRKPAICRRFMTGVNGVRTRRELVKRGQSPAGWAGHSSSAARPASTARGAVKSALAPQCPRRVSDRVRRRETPERKVWL
jgi:hypothetical protein